MERSVERRSKDLILLDSNILIYLRDPKLSERIAVQLHDSRLHTCNIVIAEVLGYKDIDNRDARYFEDLFAAMKNHAFDDAIISKVIEIRRTVNIGLPDSIIAATALVNDLTLWTHNTEDFEKIPKLRLFDPVVS
jgi:predicted nucleic acid-binding protein